MTSKNRRIIRSRSYIKMLCKAWKHVSRRSIKNCFRHAGWQASRQSQDRTSSGVAETQTTHESFVVPESVLDNTEIVSFSEEIQATTTITKLLSTEGGGNEREGPQEVNFDIEGENDYITEPFDIHEHSRAQQIVGYAVPDTEVSSTGDKVDTNTDSTSAPNITNWSRAKQTCSPEQLQEALSTLKSYTAGLEPRATEDNFIKITRELIGLLKPELPAKKKQKNGPEKTYFHFTH